MKVTKKCDVYSFGVVALEVMKGKHPGDNIVSLTSLQAENNVSIRLADFLDERLFYPDDTKIQNILIGIIMLAKECLNANSQSRPTMRDVCNLLLTSPSYQFCLR